MLHMNVKKLLFGTYCLQRHKKPRCASTGSFFKYISFYYFLFTKYFFISLNSFLLFFFPLCYGLQIGLTCFALHGIYDVDTAVAHSVNMVDNAVVWLGKFCLAFSFTDTFYMGFSHLDTKIEDLFLSVAEYLLQPPYFRSPSSERLS